MSYRFTITTRTTRVCKSTTRGGIVRGILGLSAVIVLVIAVGWGQGLRDRFIPRRWGEVVPGKIYRSGQLSRYLVKSQLKTHGIQVVVDLTGDDPHNTEQPAERAAIGELGIELHRCPLIGDGTGDVRQYAAAVKALYLAEKNGKKALVHCHAGAQRTGGVVVAYRMLVQQVPPSEAYRELVAYGWNPQKDGVLVTYLDEHMQQLAEELVATGVLERMPERIPQLGSAYAHDTRHATNHSGRDSAGR